VVKIVAAYVLGGLIFSVTAYCYFHTNNQVNMLRKQADALAVEISQSREMVHILKAEWAHVSSPGHIEQLARASKLITDDIVRRGSVADNCLGSGVLVMNDGKKKR
jgi:hypothetical protein